MALNIRFRNGLYAQSCFSGSPNHRMHPGQHKHIFGCSCPVDVSSSPSTSGLAGGSTRVTSGSAHGLALWLDRPCLHFAAPIFRVLFDACTCVSF